MSYVVEERNGLDVNILMKSLLMAIYCSHDELVHSQILLVVAPYIPKIIHDVSQYSLLEYRSRLPYRFQYLLALLYLSVTFNCKEYNILCNSPVWKITLTFKPRKNFSVINRGSEIDWILNTFPYGPPDLIFRPNKHLRAKFWSIFMIYIGF